MLSNSLEDLQAGFMRVKNKRPVVDIPSEVLLAFSETINKSPLEEDYANGRGKHDNNKTEYNGKCSKRKAWEIERKVAASEMHSGKKVEQDSRIVRLSRLTAGKDRHSKVSTARGLRDRRVRLSGPTAIQLYDLQDRLCLEQPSMAVDWLIKAAKSAIDELNLLDAEMTSASAGNLGQLTSSNCSNVEHCVGSPRESATAAAASELEAFRVGLSSPKALDGMDSCRAINGKAISDLGRSSSSTSDGSIRGSAEYTSNFSMSKSASRREKRSKARERARKKSASVQNPLGSPPGIQQLSSMKPSSTSLFKSYFQYPTLPLESYCNKDDNPLGIHTQVFSGIDSVQQLSGYTPSCTDLLCNHDSHPFQSMPSYSTAALQKSLQTLPSTTTNIQAVNSCIQSYENTDSAIPFFHAKQPRHLESNGAHGQNSLCYSNNPNMIMKSGEQQQQQQAQAQVHIRHFGSTYVPTFSNEIHFSTSSLSTRGPLQSNSSSITTMPSISNTQKNTYGEASAKGAHDFVPFQDLDARVFHEFHNAQDNVKYGHSQLWAKEKEHP